MNDISYNQNTGNTSRDIIINKEDRSRSPQPVIPESNESQERDYKVQDNYVHEKEVREIIKSMNSTMDDCLKEAEKDRMRCKEWEQKYVNSTVAVASMKKQVHDLDKESKYYKEMSQKYFHELKSKEKEIMSAELEKIVHAKETQDHQSEMHLLLQKLPGQEDKDTLQKFIDEFATLKASYRMLTNDMEDIVNENKEMRARIENFEEEKFGMRTCQNCHEKFSPLQNDEGSCHYHPGKLKFYSCRGCGRDEYFTCCNKCKECSPGCKATKHIGPSEV